MLELDAFTCYVLLYKLYWVGFTVLGASPSYMQDIRAILSILIVMISSHRKVCYHKLDPPIDPSTLKLHLLAFGLVGGAIVGIQI